jgi:DNA-binding PadR family transcriptional regulator
MNRSHDASQPLTAVEFEILLSLANDDLHGYAILQEIESRSGARLGLLPGTLYRALNRLLKSGWVAERSDASASQDDSRRRIYHLTPEGRRRATREAERLARQLITARARNILRKGESR